MIALAIVRRLEGGGKAVHHIVVMNAARPRTHQLAVGTLTDRVNAARVRVGFVSLALNGRYPVVFRVHSTMLRGTYV